MIRFRIKELIQDRSYEEGRRITMEEVANATGVHRTTLTKLSNPKGYNATIDVVDRLCSYFEVPIEKLCVHIPEPDKLKN